MKIRDFRTGWRILMQERGYSAIAISGLAVGLAAFFLLLSYVHYCFSYDSWFPDADRIYVVKHKMNLLDKPQWMELVPLAFRDELKRNPMVEKSSAFVERPGAVGVDERVQSLDLYAVDSAFAQMFGVVPLAGNLEIALSHPDTLAITYEGALKLFGTAEALGRIVQIQGKAFTVAALLPNPPANSTVKYEAIMALNNAAWPEAERQAAFAQWAGLGGKIFIKLAPGADQTALTSELQRAVDQSPLRTQFPARMLEQLGDKTPMEVRLGALRDAYFDKDVAESFGSGKRGNKTSVLGAAAIAAVILALAVTNYVNLATIRTVRRQREIAVRKVLGAGTGQLVSQFLAESLMVSMLAAVLGWILAAVSLPIFSDLINMQLESLLSPVALIVALMVGVAVGMMAGIYPAWVALHVRPAKVLGGRGNSEGRGGLILRRVLTVLQFGVAMSLASTTLAIAWQTSFANRIDPGFDTSRYLALDLNADLKDTASRAFRENLARLPGSGGAEGSMDAIGRARQMTGWEQSVSRSGAGSVIIHLLEVTPGYFHLFEVKPIAGRLFDPAVDSEVNTTEVIVNAAAARLLGYDSPDQAVGQPIKLSDESQSRTIIGIFPDMQVQTLHSAVAPLMYRIGSTTKLLTVRGDGDMEALKTSVEGLWHQYFPNDVLHMETERTYFAARYADDTRLARLLTIATAITVAIAAFGIYVLAAYSVQRRAREIVLRKLFGARAHEIVSCVGSEFLKLIALSALFALPVAAYAIERYLSSFVEHAPIGVWTMVASFVFALLLGIAATLNHIREALRLAPSHVLRS